MNCQDSQGLVHAYADDELDVATARELDAHVQNCRSCSQAFEMAKAMKAALANPALYHKAPPLLWERVLRSTRREDAGTRPQPRWHMRWAPIGVAASIVAVSLAAFALLGQSRQPQVALDEQEILDSHIRSLQSPEDSHLFDVRSKDQHTVKPWFDQHVDFSPTVTQLASDGFPLLGGRLDYIHGHPVAALVYGRGSHKINLFIWPGESSPSTSASRGFNLLHWSGEGMTYWAVSDLNPADLQQFVTMVRATPPLPMPPANKS